MGSSVGSNAQHPQSGGIKVRASSGRRRDDVDTMKDLLKDSIVIKVPRKISAPPRSLQPLLLLPREQLALSCLDLSSPQGLFESSRYYESNIKILDLESRMGTRPVVLVARHESSQTSYALERQDHGLYTLCKLGSWVNLQALSSVATVTNSRLIRPCPVPDGTGGPEPSTTPQLHKQTKQKRLAVEAIQSLVKRPARSKSLSVASQGGEMVQTSLTSAESKASQNTIKEPDKSRPDESAPDTQAAKYVVVAPGVDESLIQPTASDILDNIRNQYFEALYHSMGSLAYFAKGPLSRARAAFHLDCDSTLEMNDLVEFLKSLVLSTIQIDKKYKETIPDIIAKMKTRIADSENEQGPKASKLRAKKMKLGTNVLYPNEDEHVRHWWNLYKPQLKDDDMTAAVPQATRLQIECLRSRETQLQMILILEILALESLLSADASNDSQLPGLPGDEPVIDGPKEAQKKKKKRNKHNFPMLLDVLADRLSIWQELALDEMKMMDDSQNTQRTEAQKAGKSTSDPLKDFCVDIIVPFFSPRLPEHCDSINRKLGGPIMPSPQKPKKKKLEQPSKSKYKPGAVTKRIAPPKSSHALERFLSKESEQNRRSVSRGPSGKIALLRSASIPSAPMLKREASEPVSILELPPRDSRETVGPQSRPSSALSLPSVKRNAGEEKVKKEAQVKAQLQDAISNMRKPNRDVVGKAMAEVAEKRATTSLSQLRKSKKPIQHHRFPNIVKATPVGARFRDALASEAHSQPVIGLRSKESIEAEFHAPISSSLIPSSAPRKRNRDEAPVEEVSALPPLKRHLEQVDTTTAPPSSLQPNFAAASGSDEGVVLASSPVFSRNASQSNYLAVPPTFLGHRDIGISMPSSPGHGDLSETPMKQRHVGGIGSLESFVTVTPVKKRVVDHYIAASVGAESKKENEAAKKMTVFEKLGWDEDDYDDLA